jgi:hypothetical protein
LVPDLSTAHQTLCRIAQSWRPKGQCAALKSIRLESARTGG